MTAHATTGWQAAGQGASCDQDDVHVLFIAGIGRSGSTLLCRTLGSVDGLFGAGELMRILGRGVTNGDLCSCASPVAACEVWRAVLDDLAQRSPNVDLGLMEETRRRITEGWEFLRYLFVPERGTAFARDLAAYRQFLGALYQSVRAVTGARVVVDASKNLLFAKILTETPGVRVSLVHLVRDSRGVAHSLAKKQVRPGTSGRREHFRQQGALLGSTLWNTANVMTEWLRRRASRSVRVRYEDFIAEPSAAIVRILDVVAPGANRGSLAHINGRSVRLGVDHLIASNPNRSRRGDVPLREDLAWQREMTPWRRALVTGMTLPLLLRYGYSDRSGPASGYRKPTASR